MAEASASSAMRNQSAVIPRSSAPPCGCCISEISPNDADVPRGENAQVTGPPMLGLDRAQPRPSPSRRSCT